MARSFALTRSARWLLLSIFGTVGAAAPVAAQNRTDTGPCAIIPCPPCPIPTTGQPSAPLNLTPSAPAAEPTPSFSGTLGGAGVGVSTAINSPNMMGDLLGARSLRIGFQRTLTATFTGVPSVPGGVLVSPSRGTVLFTPVIPGQGDIIGPRGPFPTLGRISPFTQPVTAGSATLTPAQTATARAILQSGLSGRPLTATELAGVSPAVLAQLPTIQGVIADEISRSTNGLAAQELTVRDVSGVLRANGDLVYTALLTGETVLALPASGGVVGRVKLAEDNNPLPRDRFIFNYDYFDNVPFTPAGMSVNRFQFGFEKTLFNGRASFEFRVPFAGTLDSTSVQGLEGRNTEMGNVRFAAKYLLMRGESVNVSTGVGVSLPTADDQVVFSSLDGSELYRFRNESVQVEPFVALLFTPNERAFGQVWSSVNFDTSGGTLTYNRAVFGGSGSVDFIDVPYLAVDTQIGYWVYQSDIGTLRGLAPFLELHWNYAIAQNTLITEANDRTRNEGLTVSSVAGNELNLTAGVTALLKDNLSVTVGASAPLLVRPDRTFDAQLGVRVNWFFGRTARDRSPAAMSSSY